MIETLISRIRSPWNFTRWLYLIMGVTITIQGSMIGQFMGIFLGLYFTSMAVFSFGCASGACFTPIKSTPKDYSSLDVEFTEIKSESK